MKRRVCIFVQLNHLKVHSRSSMYKFLILYKNINEMLEVIIYGIVLQVVFWKGETWLVEYQPGYYAQQFRYECLMFPHSRLECYRFYTMPIELRRWCQGKYAFHVIHCIRPVISPVIFSGRFHGYPISKQLLFVQWQGLIAAIKRRSYNGFVRHTVTGT